VCQALLAFFEVLLIGRVLAFATVLMPGKAATVVPRG
jgi:hypothetical protein